MKRNLPALRLALLACCTLPGLSSCHAQTKASATTQQKIATLQQLRDSGILSGAEYDQRVAALQPAAAARGASHTTPAKLGTPTVSHTLEDRGWGIPWGTIKLPAGWGFNGSVVHGDNCMVSGDNPMWVAESPDKNVGITVLPVLKAGYVSDRGTLAQMQQAGCPILRSTKAADYLTQVVLPHLHKTFTVVGTAPEPMLHQMVDELSRQSAQMNQMAINDQRMQNHDTVDSARVVITYEEAGATRVEMASAELSCHVMRMAGMGNGMPPAEFIDCTSYQTVIMHAPEDGTPVTSLATADFSKSTDKPFFTVTQNPAWQQRFEQVSQQKSQQLQAQNNANLRATQANIQSSQNALKQNHDATQSVADYSRQVHNNVYQNQQRANDQVTGAYAAHMGDYNVYTNNGTGQQYQMSNQYNNSYVNQSGSVALQTNSAGSPGVDWTALTPKY